MRQRRAPRRIVMALLFAATVLGSPAAAEDQMSPDEWNRLTDWSRKVADEVEKFLPSPLSALTDRFPWDRPDYVNRAVKTWGCGESVCPSYFPVRVSRSWGIADAASVKEYEVLRQQKQAQLRRSEELGRKISRQESDEVQTELVKIGSKQKRIEENARSIDVTFRVNTTAQDRLGVNAKPVGGVRGYPLYRERYGQGEVQFGVYLGPQGFKDPPVPRGQNPPHGGEVHAGGAGPPLQPLIPQE